MPRTLSIGKAAIWAEAARSSRAALRWSCRPRMPARSLAPCGARPNRPGGGGGAGAGRGASEPAVGEVDDGDAERAAVAFAPGEDAGRVGGIGRQGVGAP